MSKAVTIYTIDNCPYCSRAKTLLGARKIEFTEVKVNRDDECTRADLEERSGLKTFPQIFFGNHPIGGFRDLQRIDEEQNLKELINKLTGLNQQ